MSKRGDLKYSPLIEIIIAVFIVIALTGLLILLYKLIFSPSITCDNIEDWNSLKKMLNSVDSNSFTTYEAYFYNKGCYLVSFTPAQPATILAGNKVVVTQPILCLCKIEGSKCNAYDCFKFNYYTSIIDEGTSTQFKTIDYQETLFLNFKKSDKTLKLKKTGQAIVYDSQDTEPSEENEQITKSLQEIKLTEQQINERTIRIWPVSDPVLSSCYGSRTVNNKQNWHTGLDFSTPVGTPVYAVADGTVYDLCTDEDYNIIQTGKPRKCSGNGINIILKHDDGTFTRYSHLSKILVQKGEMVTKAQKIAETGNTGYSTGPHLDFKVYPSNDFNKYTESPPYKNDPINYLPELAKYQFTETAQSCQKSPTVLALKESGKQIEGIIV